MEQLKNKPFELFFADEMRYGLMSNFRRSWSKVGERAVMPQRQSFQNHYLFSAVSPISGESFHLLGIDEMDSAATRAFLTALKEKHQDQQVVIVWDNAPCHRPRAFREILGLTIIFLPPYSPELNPAERFFEEMRRATCNTLFESLEQQEQTIASAVNQWADDIPAMQQLLGYAWIKEQCSGVN